MTVMGVAIWRVIVRDILKVTLYVIEDEIECLIAWVIRRVLEVCPVLNILHGDQQPPYQAMSLQIYNTLHKFHR